MAAGLFGTDGVRGVAGERLTVELALALGRAVAAETASPPQGLVVRDTRESGPMLESALAAGIAAAGGGALLAGVLPTPAASVLVRRLGLGFAAVISASHNPWQDNGIKFFGPDGRKLDDELEGRVERRVLDTPPTAPAELGTAAPGSARFGRVGPLEGALDDYLRELERTFRLDLRGRRIVLDCANGATHRAAPAAFRRLGAEPELLGDEPDGRNINEGCGSTHPERLAEHVAAAGGEAIGFAFDGDGDRVIAVDEGGQVRDGDELIALCAADLSARGELAGGVAVTVMSNYGLHTALREQGIEVATTSVGDRHVSAELDARGWTLGGEQSGHLIWTGFGPTGDGIAAALLALRALGDRRLADTVPMERLPQVLESVRVADRGAVDAAAAVWEAVERESAGLEGRGRVLIRPSGTEPVVRVMVEAPEADECRQICARLVEIVQRELA